jgi:hypothetical protein
VEDVVFKFGAEAVHEHESQAGRDVQVPEVEHGRSVAVRATGIRRKKWGFFIKNSNLGIEKIFYCS